MAGVFSQQFTATITVIAPLFVGNGHPFSLRIVISHGQEYWSLPLLRILVGDGTVSLTLLAYFDLLRVLGTEYIAPTFKFGTFSTSCFCIDCHFLSRLCVARCSDRHCSSLSSVPRTVCVLRIGKPRIQHVLYLLPHCH
jgi:hypothetical protein